MEEKRPITAGQGKAETPSSGALVEEIMGQKLEDLATVLAATGNGRSRLYEEVLDIVERCLFRIALERSGNVKCAAAAYLGINRNTFQKKLVRLGLDPRTGETDRSVQDKRP